MIYDPHEPDWDPEEEAARYAEEVQPLIEYCYNCQPWEGGEIAAWILGERTDLTDVFEMAEVPEDRDLREGVAALLRCLNCGTTGFDLSTEVGIKGEFERMLEERLGTARALYSARIQDFQAFLERTPALGVAHELGKLILDRVQSATVPRCSIAGSYFRARLSENPRVLESADLGPPPGGKAADARFNHAGQSVFYLASGKEVAMAEALGDRPSGLLWIQEFRLNDITPILDLSVEAEQLPDDQDLLIALLESEAFARAGGESESNWKPGYLLPRFVADCAKHSGYVGIRYPSARTHGDNVVLLDPKAIRDSVSEVGPPEIAVRRPPGKPKF